MLHHFTPLRLPSFASLRHLEGTGNFAVKKYYTFPYRFFYRHKLRMIVNLMPRKEIYHNILDFGAGSGIFEPELKRYALFVKRFDTNDVIDKRWRFDAIVCASVLEFCQLPHTIGLLHSLLKPGGKLYVASPMETGLTKAYFKWIKDTNKRNSHTKILSDISKQFRIEEYHSWMDLYFAVRASRN